MYIDYKYCTFDIYNEWHNTTCTQKFLQDADVDLFPFLDFVCLTFFSPRDYCIQYKLLLP
jgi:hypothetical protein